MNLSKFVVFSCCFAFCLSFAGCGSSSDTTVIEAPQQTAEEVANADAAYDEAYSKQAEEYEAAQ